MKINNLKKNLVAFGLATSIGVSMNGCCYQDNTQNIEIASDSNAKNETYKTEDYSLIYLNENLYLCKKLTYAPRSEIQGKFTDAKTKELVGFILKFKRGEYIENNKYDVMLKDYNWSDGEYGYGKMLPYCSEIPISKLITSSRFNQDMFDFLSSNSEELKETILNTVKYNKYSLPKYMTQAGLDYETKMEEVNLKKYVCQTKEGQTNVYLGYRCSTCENDIGYSYIYDILTGTIQYIGFITENHFVSVQESNYDNKENKTIAVLKNEIKTPEKKEVEKKIRANDIWVLNTKNSIVISQLEEEEEYYFLWNTWKPEENPIKEDDTKLYLYKDIYHENAEMIATANPTKDGGSYIGKTSIIIDINNSSSCLSINDFLKSQGLEDMISQNKEYSYSEIDSIYNYVMKNNNSLSLQRKR